VREGNGWDLHYNSQFAENGNLSDLSDTALSPAAVARGVPLSAFSQLMSPLPPTG